MLSNAILDSLILEIVKVTIDWIDNVDVLGKKSDIFESPWQLQGLSKSITSAWWSETNDQSAVYSL